MNAVEFETNSNISSRASNSIIDLMYRPSNQRYSEGANMKPHNNYPYPPPSEHSVPKMHMDNYQSTMPPVYDFMPNNNSFDYMPPNNNGGPPDNFDRGYPPPSWRDPSQSNKIPQMGAMNMGPSGHNTPVGHFDVRGMQGHGDYQGNKPMPESYMPPPANPPLPPQMNVVQRISGLIKSQLSVLQGILSYAQKKTNEERKKKDRSRSRSRERGERKREHRQWNCPRCNFLNFDFRNECKKCNERKPTDKGDRENRGGGSGFQPRGYVPGPDDWRCLKCSNINYARRTQCHRCHAPRGR